MTKQQAQEKATEILDQIGAEGMSSECVVLEATEREKFWTVYCERLIGGVPVATIEYMPQMQTDTSVGATPAPEAFNRPFYPESLIFRMSDKGILSFEWKNLDKITGTVTENAEPQPFEKVMKRAKDNMFYKMAADKESASIITVKTARLSYMRVLQKDAPGSFLYVPV